LRTLTEDTQLFEKICNDLVELKDTSELMMDMAYSALLLNSHQLAEEVLELEDRMDRLHTEFELMVLSAKNGTQEAAEGCQDTRGDRHVGTSNPKGRQVDAAKTLYSHRGR